MSTGLYLGLVLQVTNSEYVTIRLSNGQDWGELKNELELFNSILEFELELESKDFYQAEFELKDFE